MNGLIALLGSGEYLSVMDDVDAYLLANCGANGRKPRVVCLPTAAGREGDASVTRWSRMGGVYAGCSTGAMILAKEVPDFRAMGLRSISAFGLIPAAFVMPHFDAIPLFGKPLVATLRKRLSEGEVMIGVDENTAVVGKLNEEWTVLGEASAHIFTRDENKSYAAGEKFSLGK